MGANERRRWQQRKLQQLGARAPANTKMPIKMLVGMRRKGVEREKKKVERDKEMGNYVKSKSAKPSDAGKKKGQTGKGSRWVDRSSIQDARIRGGILKVNPRDIR